MATRYVWSGAGGSADGSSWANAHLTFAAAVTASTAGDLFLVDSTHSESNASAQTLTFKGTSAAPDTVISVLQATGVPTQGAAFITTGANGMSVAGSGYFDGLNLTAGSASNAAVLTLAGSVGNNQRWRNGLFTLSNATGSRLASGNSAGQAIFEKNVTVAATHANNWVRPGSGAIHIWRDSTCFTGTVPSSLAEAAAADFIYEGCDLTSMVSKTIRATSASAQATVLLVNCQLIASTTVGAMNNRNEWVRLVNCANSADGKNRTEYHDMSGAATIDRTTYRTGGASDGVDAFSYKLVSTSAANRYFPCQSQDVEFHVASTGSKTVTLHIVNGTGAGVTLTDAECWLEVDYLGTATSFDSSVITDANILQAAGVAQTTSVEAWTQALSTPVYQQLEVTFTTNTIGMHRLRVKLARASTTIYACPKVVVT